MIVVYQMLHGLVDVDTSFFISPTVYTSTRGHNVNLTKEHFHKNVRSYTFSTRVINNWNSLPDYIVKANSLSSLKKFLDEHRIDHYFM